MDILDLITHGVVGVAAAAIGFVIKAWIDARRVKNEQDRTAIEKERLLEEKSQNAWKKLESLLQHFEKQYEKEQVRRQESEATMQQGKDEPLAILMEKMTQVQGDLTKLSTKDNSDLDIFFEVIGQAVFSMATNERLHISQATTVLTHTQAESSEVLQDMKLLSKESPGGGYTIEHHCENLSLLLDLLFRRVESLEHLNQCLWNVLKGAQRQQQLLGQFLVRTWLLARTGDKVALRAISEETVRHYPDTCSGLDSEFATAAQSHLAQMNLLIGDPEGLGTAIIRDWISGGEDGTRLLAVFDDLLATP